MTHKLCGFLIDTKESTMQVQECTIGTQINRNQHDAELI